MKQIHYLFIAIFATMCCVSCNDEWVDEQYEQTVSFKATPNEQGVTPIYVRYKTEGKVTYDLPIIISGSTPNSQKRTVKIGLDPDTLAVINQEVYGQREELYFRQLDASYYSMAETQDITSGESTGKIAIDFSLANLDQTDKWVLPLQILDDPIGNYKANYHKYYRKALLHVNPFNDYSGSYSGTLYKIFLEPDTENAVTMSNIRTYVVDDSTIFLYAGLRDIDYLDRKYYKIFIKFTDERIDINKKKLEIYTDNPLINLSIQSEPYYVIEEEVDPVKVYMKHIYITLGLNYTFEDYTTIPDTPIKYSVTGTLVMQRDLNTLIPDEDQQIQW